ncbi:MAG TPA: lytic transglycosylase domain-containing protein [Candidatus Saccharibacteria bacterium]|nr:lytic transglycosylase domain-containing protein [Candidatus Saccharibacteria bacterium]
MTNLCSMTQFKNKKIVLRLLILLMISILLVPQGVFAISGRQRVILQRGIPYFDLEVATCQAENVSVSQTLPDSIPQPYKQLIETASASAGINPNLLAAIFVTEHGNNWPDPAGPWASSPVGASGPFQFMPGTWSQYGQGGNVQSLEDSTNAAARYLKAMGLNPDSPLGTLEQPYVRDPMTMLYMAGSYNAGGGNMDRLTTPTSGVDGKDGRLYKETVTYVKNVFNLISSGFAHGVPGYGSPDGTVRNGTAGNNSTSQVGTASSCQGNGVVSGDIVKTALNLAWPDRGHGKNKEDATQAYQTTLPTTNPDLINDIWSDCGSFVNAVMRSSGADPDYYIRGTIAQLSYARNNPGKYLVIDGISDTSLLQPGDILVNSKHTMIYVGNESGTSFNAAHASLGGHVPEAGNFYPGFSVVRIKK